MDDGAHTESTAGSLAAVVRAGAEPDRRVRIALVGAGLVGQAGHVISLAEDPDRFELVEIVDPYATVRTAVARAAWPPPPPPAVTASRTPRPISTRPWPSVWTPSSSPSPTPPTVTCASP